MDFIILLITAYLIGSLPFGLLLCFIFGYGDIRKIGSGNIGATNVLRTGNKLLALLTLILDSSKGAIAVLLLPNFPLYHAHCPSIRCLPPGPCGGCWHPSFSFVWTEEILLLGFFAILGHCFPIWLKFKGGKGVATTLGALLAVIPWTGVLACVSWGIVTGFFRISSLSALSAMALAPVFTMLFYGPVPAIVNVMISALVFWRHKENIRRLIKGTEPKIGEKKNKPEESHGTTH